MTSAESRIIGAAIAWVEASRRHWDAQQKQQQAEAVGVPLWDALALRSCARSAEAAVYDRGADLINAVDALARITAADTAENLHTTKGYRP